MRKIWRVGIACFLLGLLAVPVAAFVYLRFGRLPVAVADSAFPFEKQIVRVPLHARIDSEMQTSTMIASDTNLAAGAAVYREQCAFCHGLPGEPSKVAGHMYPGAPQLWAKHKNGVVGVSDDPVGETFWRVKNGIRLTGMPAYGKLLSDDQMWQVSLLVKGAADVQPPAVQSALAAK